MNVDTRRLQDQLEIANSRVRDLEHRLSEADSRWQLHSGDTQSLRKERDDAIEERDEAIENWRQDADALAVAKIDIDRRTEALQIADDDLEYCIELLKERGFKTKKFEDVRKIIAVALAPIDPNQKTTVTNRIGRVMVVALTPTEQNQETSIINGMKP